MNEGVDHHFPPPICNTSPVRGILMSTMNRTRSRLMLTLVVALLALQPLLHLHPIDSVHANGTSGLQCALCVDAHVETLPTGCILPRLAALPELVQSEPAGDASPAFVSSLPSRGPPAA